MGWGRGGKRGTSVGASRIARWQRGGKGVVKGWVGVEGKAAYGDHAGAVLIGNVCGAKGEESPAAQDLRVGGRGSGWRWRGQRQR